MKNEIIFFRKSFILLLIAISTLSCVSPITPEQSLRAIDTVTNTAEKGDLIIVYFQDKPSISILYISNDNEVITGTKAQSEPIGKGEYKIIDTKELINIPYSDIYSIANANKEIPGI